MSTPRAAHEFMEVFLQPGDVFFADADTRLRTLLGSCVSVTIWHPVERAGGMCHFLLPTRRGAEEHLLEGRYGDEALFMLLREARHHGFRPRDFQYKVFGGAWMSTHREAGQGRRPVGLQNVELALEVLDDLGIRPVSQDVGGLCARSIMLDNWSGDVWLRQTHPDEAAMMQEALVQR